MASASVNCLSVGRGGACIYHLKEYVTETFTCIERARSFKRSSLLPRCVVESASDTGETTVS